MAPNRFKDYYSSTKSFIGDLRSTDDETLAEDLRSPGSASVTGARKNVTYTGVDIKAIVHVPVSSIIKRQEATAEQEKILKKEKDLNQHTTLVLADLQTITWSIHREKYPIRALNHIYPKGFARGTRTIAGSMIFTVFNEHTLAQLIRTPPNDFAYSDLSAIMIDQLPPFDVSLVFANEYGHLSQMAILGIELVNEGMTFSIQDLMTENAVSYMARELVPLKAVGFAELAIKDPRQDGKSISNFIIENDKNVEFIDRLSESTRELLKKTRNPFR